jgi:lysyl-tRNA synthetase class 2
MGGEMEKKTEDSELGTKEREIYEGRLEKARRWRELGANPWSNGYSPEHLAAQVIQRHGSQSAEELEKEATQYRIAGRIVALRSFGKAAFIKVRDRSGEIQAHLKKEVLGDAYELFKQADLGDFVAVEGRVFRTHKGELTIEAHQFQPLTKSLRPLPEKWHGLVDVEARYRQRYLDLISNPAVKEIFLRRYELVRSIRQFLDARGFVEVETPMMHSLISGAAARPFVTHHHALDIDLYLRVAPELHLKRLVVGGLERVYELNRNFRNEGMSTRHNPEFTMLEFYMSYATYETLMDLTEEMISEAAQRVVGNSRVTYQEHSLDFRRGWRRLTMVESICEQQKGLQAKDLSDPDRLRRELVSGTKDPAERKAIEQMSLGELIGGLFERWVEPTLIQPTFITHFPTAISPLARRNDANPEFADRFELFAAGREIANGFSELNDPMDQRERFLAQLEAKRRGKEETMDYDEDYIRALEHGLPPTAGEGIGIDRLAMLFTNSASIRDVILFPLLKPVPR